MRNTRERLLASSMICGAAFLGLSATSAYAAAADAGNGEVSEIVVTGTRIPSPNLTSVAPITTVGSADIKSQGGSDYAGVSFDCSFGSTRFAKFLAIHSPICRIMAT